MASRKPKLSSAVVAESANMLLTRKNGAYKLSEARVKAMLPFATSGVTGRALNGLDTALVEQYARGEVRVPRELRAKCKPHYEAGGSQVTWLVGLCAVNAAARSAK